MIYTQKMARYLIVVLAMALCVFGANATSASERQRLRVELHKNSADLADLNKKAAELISFVEKSQQKDIPVAKNAKGVETSNGNPYGFMAKAGRGEEDKHTMFYGTYGGSYGPVSSLVNGGMPGMSTGVDPRGFGGPRGVAFPAPTTVWGAPVPGVSARGFTYAAPNLPINQLYPVSGLPFPSAHGPYYHAPVGQPNSRNFTQFGPHPFGPYGVNGFATRSVIPKHLPYGLGNIGMTLGGFGGIGAHPSVIPTTYPAQYAPIPSLATKPQLAGFPNVYPSTYYPTHGVQGVPGQYPNYGGPGFIPVIHSPFNLGFPGSVGNSNINMQASWLPGVQATYRPGMEFHHATNLPGGNMQTWKTPSLKFGMGQGYPHPDFDRYSSVSSGVAPPRI